MSNRHQSGIISWFASNHVAANILMLLFILGGFISIKAMRTETFPSIDPKLISVSVVYPGATPYEVADGVTNRAEEALIGIDGVKRISSSALEGYGVVNVELEDFANADDVYNEVETAINGLIDFPPQNAERAIITKAKVTPNVVSLALYGDVNEEALRYWTENIEDQIKQLPKVALTRVRGVKDYEISVEIAEEKLQEYGLTLQDIGNAIKNFSVDIPSGTIESSQGDISLRIQEKKYEKKDFEKIILRNFEDGSILTIGDVGIVNDGLEDVNLISRFNGKPASFIDVQRSDSEDTLEIAQIVKNYISTLELPKGLTLELQKDQTVNLKDRISLMLRNGILGFTLVFVILLVFLDLKLAFWTSIAIPISFLGGLMIMNFMGQSINMISLFALIVVLGIVVDDAIITGESIFEHQKSGEDDAVLKGVKAIIAPVTVGVTTTIAAFAPLAFSTGTLGQIIGVIPMVVIPILIVSLIEAYFILPSHLSNPNKWSRGILLKIRKKSDQILTNFVETKLVPFAKFSMKWRYATIAAFIGLFIITIGMVKGGVIRFVFFPQVEGVEIKITLTMPQGTPFYKTKENILIIEKAALDVRKELGDDGDGSVFQNISVIIGQTSSGNGSPVNKSSRNFGSNLGQIEISLVPSDFRTKSSSQIEAMIRQKVQDLPGIEKLEFLSSPIGEDADIEIELSHPNEEELLHASKELKELLAQINGTKEVADSFEEGKEEFIFKLNDQGRAVGLSPANIGTQLRSAFFGLEAQRFQRQNSEIIAYVRYNKEQRESLQALQNSRIRLADGSEVPLIDVVDIIRKTGFSVIETVDGRRIVKVTGDVDYAITTPNDVIFKLQSEILPKIAQKYPSLTYSFEGESREQKEDLQSLGSNMLIALLLIFILLGSQLRSYIQPIIIMSAIPFGIVGAIWGHFLLGHDLTFISFFGIVALMGVVVNDSVVLVDYLNIKILEGNDISASALQAIKRRFRPILLTTMTTCLGLLPMLFETSMQATFLVPMVISLATGILFATIIILILVPNLVLISDDVKTSLTKFYQNLVHKKYRSEIEEKKEIETRNLKQNITNIHKPIIEDEPGEL